MEYYISQLINGICQGAIYALMAIGYSVIVGVVGMVNFTYGEVMMLGAYTAYYCFNYFAGNLFVGIISAFLGSFFIGIFVYKTCYEHFFNAPRHIPLLCTIGVSMLLKNLAQIIFGPNTKPVQGIVNNKVFTVAIFGTNIYVLWLQIIIIAIVIVLAISLNLFINRSKYGIMLRAVSQDKHAAYLMGINVKWTVMLGNCLGCALGGVAGILLALYYYLVSPLMGSSYTMKAFAASVLGGLVDIRFSAIGGLCLGIIENLGITISSATFRDVFAFGFLILVLIIRPQGFKSKKGTKA